MVMLNIPLCDSEEVLFNSYHMQEGLRHTVRVCSKYNRNNLTNCLAVVERIFIKPHPPGFK